MENQIQKLYTCPCCGYLALELQPPGTYLFCPICFWVDEGEEYNSIGNHQISLRQAQLNFLEFGACDEEWLNYVRRPTANDIHDSNWQLREKLVENMRLTLMEKVARAFDNVSIENGISLHGARALDDWYSMEEARKISQEMDRGKKWQDVPKELIEKLGDSFGFLDPKGFRYYLPAFMIYSLQNYSSGYAFIDSVYFALANQTRYYQKYQKHLALLNQEQLEVAQEYVSFMKTYAY